MLCATEGKACVLVGFIATLAGIIVAAYTTPLTGIAWGMVALLGLLAWVNTKLEPADRDGPGKRN